jgi:hypothetical protein
MALVLRWRNSIIVEHRAEFVTSREVEAGVVQLGSGKLENRVTIALPLQGARRDQRSQYGFECDVLEDILIPEYGFPLISTKL